MIFFRNKFKSLRESFGLTQQDVADVAGVSEAAVSGWENGTNSPRPARIKKLAALLRCQESDLARYGGPLEKALDSMNEREEQIRAMLFGADVADEIGLIERALDSRSRISPRDPNREAELAEENAEIRENLYSMFRKLCRQLKVADLPENALDDFKFGLLRALIKSDIAPADKDKALKIVENFGAEK